MTERSRSPEGEQLLDTGVANEARVYDYLLGGDANFAIDREVAERQGAAVGGIDNARAAVRANRVFLRQVVEWLVEQGVRQFLDIGSGIPTGDNVHEVAQAAAPESRIVYTDYDPIVLAHAHQLELASSAEGVTEYFQADFRDPGTILERAAETLDFDQPIAVLLISFLHFFADAEDPQRVVTELMDATCSCSYLAVSHLTADMEPERMSALVDAPGDEADYMFVMRSQSEVSAFFDGLEPAVGGVVPMTQWLPPDTPIDQTQWARMYYCGTGRKP